MRRLITASVKPAALLSTAALAAGLFMPYSSEAVSVTTTQLQLFADQTQASVNGLPMNLDEPATIIDGHFYIPAKWFADTLGFSLEWDSADHKIRLLAPRAYIEFDAPGNTVTVNGNAVPFETVAEIRGGRLLVKLSWLAQYADLPFRYNEDTRSIEVTYTGLPSGPYKESLLHKDDSQPNSRPAAVFAFGKPEYRLGEPVDYIDLSYDPDAEGLPEYDWNGKEEAFFEPGVYTVTLQVSDGHGNRSEPFSKSVTVLDEPYVSEQDFPLYFKPAGTAAIVRPDWLKGLQTAASSKLPVVVRQPSDRPLITGGGSRPVTEKGFLYRDRINQSARLSLQYVNGLDMPVQFAVVLRNESATKPVKVTGGKGAEAQSSVYTPLVAYKTAEQFLVGGPSAEELTIEPGGAVFYKISPETAPGQGFHGLYDIDTDGVVSVSYVMMEPGEKLHRLGSYSTVSLEDDASATYPVSEVGWQVDARGIKKATAIGIGDSMVEPAIQGVNALSKQPAPAQAFAGVRYRIGVDVSGQTTLALHPRGGFFHGAIRVDGNAVTIPPGGLTSNDLLVLHRTTAATGKTVEVELIASNGSSAPLDLIVFPLHTGSE